LCLILNILVYINLGAFGVVHKGELTETDGSVMPVAIKTIKCELLDVTL